MKAALGRVVFCYLLRSAACAPRAAAHALHAQGGTNTKAGTAAFLERFERQVDPDGRLTPEERTRRAAHARKSYMAGLALKASQRSIIPTSGRRGRNEDDRPGR
ncbi:MAG: hypothetical protein WKF78_12820 [Candidatus Limnocylindrales bacterium]